MLKGIHLTLLIGPSVPVPAPQPLMDALISVQVTDSSERSGFQISFAVSKSPVFQTLIASGFFDPISTRVVIIATLNALPNVLMDGFITSHELTPSSEPGKSTFTITGEDVSLAMDLNQITMPLPMPDPAKVYTLLAPFAFLGLVPVVIPPIVSPVKSPTTQIEYITKQTPRAFLKALAQKSGYIFTVLPGPLPGSNIAYFGPDMNLPIPQPALSINMDSGSNVESLSFSLNGLAKKIRIYTILDPITKKIPVPLPVPNINALKPPLGLRPAPLIQKTEFADDVSKLDPAAAAQKIIGDAISSASNPPAITSNGSLDVLRYNNVLRSRMLVGVRGAGISYDGMYYVDSVTHNIKPGQYRQSFTLSRDGLISNTPVVLP